MSLTLRLHAGNLTEAQSGSEVQPGIDSSVGVPAS